MLRRSYVSRVITHASKAKYAPYSSHSVINCFTACVLSAALITSSLPILPVVAFAAEDSIPSSSLVADAAAEASDAADNSSVDARSESDTALTSDTPASPTNVSASVQPSQPEPASSMALRSAVSEDWDDLGWDDDDEDDSDTPETPAPTPAPTTAVAAAVAALKKDGFSGYVPRPVEGKDTNLARMLEARLAELGHPGIRVRVKATGQTTPDPAQQGGIDVSEGAENGRIQYFFLSPDAKTSKTDISVLRNIQPVYELQKDGETAEYKPSRTTALPWDSARVQSFLEDLAAHAELPDMLTTGHAPDSLESLALPAALAGSKVTKLATVSWTSSNPQALKITTGFDSQYRPVVTATLTHGERATSVDVTATYKLFVSGYGQDVPVTVTKTYTVAVAAKSSDTAEAKKAELAAILERIQLKDFSSGEPLASRELAGDIQFSRPRDLNIDGKYYKLSYSSSDTGAIEISGYRGVSTPSLEGEAPRTAELTASLTHDGVTVSRSLGEFLTRSVSRAEIERAVAAMEAAKAAYPLALLGTNPDSSHVTEALTTFRAAVPTYGSDASVAPSITWARTQAEAGSGNIEPVDLPGFDSMSGSKWRAFRSSNEQVIASESLQVTRPAFDTVVRIESQLSYRAYESLARAYPENDQLQKLVNQLVSATVTVLGTRGSIDPDAEAVLTATVRVQGMTDPAQGTPHAETWVAPETISFKKSAAPTVWTLIAQALSNHGYSFDMTSGSPGSVTSPSGLTLSMFEQAGQWSYWSTLVNGEYAQGYPQNIAVSAGDRIELVYVSPLLNAQPTPDPQPTPQPSPDPDPTPHLDPSLHADWSGFGNGGSTVVERDGSPADEAEARWVSSLSNGVDMYTLVGDPVIVGDAIYCVTQTELIKLNRVSGQVMARTTTGAHNSYFARPFFAAGLIIIPSDGGVVSAFTADTLTRVWQSVVAPAPLVEGQELSYQAASGITLVGNTLVVPFMAGPSFDGSPSAAGALVGLDLADGHVLWTQANVRDESADSAGGYYWAGAAQSSEQLLIANDAGRVSLIESATGQVLASLKLPSSVRTAVIKGSEPDTFYVVGRSPAVLYKIERVANTLQLAGSVPFADFSTSTPAVVGNRIFVGGGMTGSRGALGVLAEIDAEHMSLIHRADLGAGEVKSTPLVVKHDGKLAVYVVTNMTPGTLFCYQPETHTVKPLYTPQGNHANYSTSSVIVDAEGNLYYSTDAGVLISLGRKLNTDEVHTHQPGSGEAETPQPGVGILPQPGDNTAQPSTPNTGDTLGHTPEVGDGSVAGKQLADSERDLAHNDKEQPQQEIPSTGPATRVTGRVAPGKRPLAAATTASDAKSTQADTAQANASVEKDTASLTEPSVSAPTTKASVAHTADQQKAGMPLALILALAGILGLACAGLWFLLLKRRQQREG
ncbi:PQQ-binding-like beta-propeller repeat protein [Collinsella sp. zg1085]|uniref:outer membrane protein assembly factor BamB family protein n=1 Tax=Collinsella sp. zg1085 TaxID=2844380 RepID=UPI001C0DA314|nr:PQQ-binding-like beta-propeller repeat protein [Collinsella sp. zg1085]QWT18189.1 PQQ-binding-like beta-propeller repeat protein [Collinsella sp. zg1085]